MIFLSTSNKQMPTRCICCIYFCFCAGKCSSCRLEERHCRGRYRPLIIQFFCLLRWYRIGKTIFKLFKAKRDSFFKIERVTQYRQRCFQCCKRQLPNTLNRCRSMAIPSAAMPLPKIICARSPPKEWPITMGGYGSVAITAT